jgi:hypothetical protein
MRVRELAEWLGATYKGDGEQELEGAGERTISRMLHFLGGMTRNSDKARIGSGGCRISGIDDFSRKRRPRGNYMSV